MNYMVSASTDVGTTKQTNQDAINVKTMIVHGKPAVFAVVCDGVGGLQKGELASATLVKAFSDWTKTRLAPLVLEGITNAAICREWNELIVNVSGKICTFGKKNGISLGSTITAMLFYESNYYIVNVGDTRAYEIGETVNVLTKDQTLVAREVELGLITPEQALQDPRKNILLQCVGASENVFPDFFFGTIKPETVYILCTDGFRHVLTMQELQNYYNPKRIVHREHLKQTELDLIEINKQRAERDNISVVSIKTF